MVALARESRRYVTNWPEEKLEIPSVGEGGLPDRGHGHVPQLIRPVIRKNRGRRRRSFARLGARGAPFTFNTQRPHKGSSVLPGLDVVVATHRSSTGWGHRQETRSSGAKGSPGPVGRHPCKRLPHPSPTCESPGIRFKDTGVDNGNRECDNPGGAPAGMSAAGCDLAGPHSSKVYRAREANTLRKVSADRRWICEQQPRPDPHRAEKYGY
jgi:hypothetical protein